MSIKRNHFFHSKESFNLVELSLAIAVVAIGVVSVFGIFPHILKSSRQAIEYSTISQMVQTDFDTNGWRFPPSPATLSSNNIFPPYPPTQPTTVTNVNFGAQRYIYSFPASNACFSQSLTDPRPYQNSSGITRPLLKTLYITYNWGNTNNSSNVCSFTFVTEIAATKNISQP